MLVLRRWSWVVVSTQRSHLFPTKAVFDVKLQDEWSFQTWRIFAAKWSPAGKIGKPSRICGQSKGCFRCTAVGLKGEAACLNGFKGSFFKGTRCRASIRYFKRGLAQKLDTLPESCDFHIFQRLQRPLISKSRLWHAFALKDQLRRQQCRQLPQRQRPNRSRAVLHSL
jgi:hypothetical protein